MAINPQEKDAIWSGQGHGNEMGLIPLSATARRQPCPFCAAHASTHGTETISLGGDPVNHPHLLITTADGRRLGMVAGRLVDQIPGARVIRPLLSDVAAADPEPVYEIPAGDRVTVTVQPGAHAGAIPASVSVTGPGYGERVTGLSALAGAGAQISLAPSGGGLSLRLTGRARAGRPAVSLGRNQGRGGHTVVAQTSGLTPGTTVSLSAGAASGRVTLSHARAPVPVTLRATTVTPHGSDDGDQPQRGRAPAHAVSRTAGGVMSRCARSSAGRVAATLGACLLLAACGSSSSSSSSGATGSRSTSTAGSSSATTSTTTASSPSPSGGVAVGGPATASVAPVPGRTVVHGLRGTHGRRAAPADLARLARAQKPTVRAHVNGLTGTVTQKLTIAANNVAGNWAQVFAKAGLSLPQAGFALIAGQPQSCGSTQITAASGPIYCPATSTIELPLGFFSDRVAPLGDGALIVMVADLYGYHVERALGLLGTGRSLAKLERIDSCLSGIYALTVYGALQQPDETSITRLFSLLAPGQGAGGVTADELANAFNLGLVVSNGDYKACLGASV